jgi:UDPglucose 6-dehydrogenase
MLAARISLMNQLADLCEAYEANISEVREGVGSDDRIGSTFLFPGIGFGGFGLPKDLATTIRLAQDKHVESDLIEAIRNVNKRRRRQFLQRILDHYGADIAGARIAIWGAAFKPRTDDIRNAPALRIIDGLLEAGAEVVVYDPVAAHKLREHYRERISIVSKYYNALEGADGLVVVTEWNEFRRPDYARMKQMMRQPVIFDARNIFTPGVMREEGFRYHSVGRPTV